MSGGHIKEDQAEKSTMDTVGISHLYLLMDICCLQRISLLSPPDGPLSLSSLCTHQDLFKRPPPTLSSGHDQFRPLLQPPGAISNRSTLHNNK